MCTNESCHQTELAFVLSKQRCYNSGKCVNYNPSRQRARVHKSNECSKWKVFVINTHFSFWRCWKSELPTQPPPQKKSLNWENSCYHKEHGKVFSVFPNITYLKAYMCVWVLSGEERDQWDEEKEGRMRASGWWLWERANNTIYKSVVADLIILLTWQKTIITI